MNKTARLDRAERELDARGEGAGRVLVAYDLSHWKIPRDVQLRCRALAQAGEREAIRAELRLAVPEWFAAPSGRGKWSTVFRPEVVRLATGDYLALDPALEPITDADRVSMLLYVAEPPREGGAR